MEGNLFYWVAWCLWIMTTFFLNKENPIRLKLSIWLLLCIIFSNRSVDMSSLQFSYSSFFILITTYMLASKLSLKRRLFYVLTSLIVSMAYVSMLLFEIFDPVLLIISREWLIPLLLAYIVFLLYTEVEMRIICLLAGSIHGEVLYAIIIKKITSNNMVGSLAYLDVISVASVIILAWYGIERLAAYFNHHFQQLEEENQKTS